MPALNHTPMRSRRGKRVHAVPCSGEGALKTACGRDFGGRTWCVATRPVNCWRCLVRLGEPVIRREHVA